ncbi:MAG: protein TraX, partial [Oscillospiraceae bacterium]|nr:protein TraX [Oscillospiraceae bacterium]
RQVFQFGGLLAPLLLKRYNGERGSAAAFHKWFFYAFYPLHLLLLWWLKSLI